MVRKTDDDLIKRLWAEGKSLRAIGKQLSCSHIAILKRLKKMGLAGSFTTQEKEAGNRVFCDKYARARVTEKKPPYFIKEGTDEIFGYTRFLAERADMKPFFGTLEDFKKGIAINPPLPTERAEEFRAKGKA